MKLIAVYIEEHHTIENMCFNFDSDYIVKFNRGCCEIQKTNKNVSKNYYGFNKKFNLILGENGTGKSTLLSSLESYFNNEYSLGFSVWLLNEELLFIDRFDLIKKINTKLKYKHSENNKDLFKANKEPVYIKLSNVIDINDFAMSKKISKNNKNYLDYSNNKIIRSKREKIAKDELEREQSYFDTLFKNDPHFEKPKYLLKIKKLSRTKIGLMTKAMDLNLKNNHDRDTYIESVDIDGYINSEDTLKFIDSLDYIQHIYLTFFMAFSLRLYERRKFNELSFDEFYIKSLISFKEYFSYHHGNEFAFKYFVEIFEYSSIASLNSIDMWLSELISMYLYDTINMINENISNLNVYKDSLSILIEDINFIHIIKRQENDIESKGFPLFNLISYGWTNMSSGQAAKLKLFSRLNESILKAVDITKSKGLNLIISIDEVDLYSHPEWQRVIISELIKYTTLRFDKPVSFHFILTTHSPIIASDLLPQDIIHLVKDDHNFGKIMINKETYGFGTSITDLFYESFSLKSTIGMHSEKILEDLIVRSKNHDLYERDIDIISSIGNETVKKILIGRYNK